MTDNFDARVVERMGADFPKWIPHAHVSHFSASTFRRLCSELAGLSPAGAASYTPWELSLLMARHRLGWRPPPFDVESVMAAEMGGSFRWPGVRRVLDPLWFRISARGHLDGQLMYVALRRGDGPRPRC
jgi:hypothetical protein